MKMTKLALAIALTVPATTFAAEYLEDEMLSDVTGQDGITLSLDLALTQNILVEDDNGYVASAVYNTAGAIQITGMSISGTGVEVSIDAGGDATTNAMLAIEVALTGGLTIQTGAITVANTDGAFAVAGSENTIFASQTIVLPNTTELRIELGSEETDFLTLTGDIGTINLGAGSLADADGSTIAWGAGSAVTGLNTSGLTVNVTTAGLVIDLTGTSMSNVGMDIIDLTFGTQPAIGDVRITGMDLTGTTLTVYGH